MLYAIKIIKERIVSKKQGALLLREVGALSLLTSLSCPNMIQYYGCWLEDSKLYIQLEWCNLGSLEDIISSNPSRYSIFCRNLTPKQGVAVDNRNRSDSCQSIENMDNFTPVGIASTGTSIFSFASNGNNAIEGISEVLAWFILKVISETLSFMHNRGKLWFILVLGLSLDSLSVSPFSIPLGLVHLDMRPANVFLQSSASNTPEYSQSQQVSPIGPGKSLFSAVIDSLSHTSLSNEHVGSVSRQSSNSSVSTDVRKDVEESILNGKYILKVGDLGHVRGLFETGFVNEGETRYCPRELINSDPSVLDLTKADVFSLAASVYELCLGRYLGSTGDEAMTEWHSIR